MVFKLLSFRQVKRFIVLTLIAIFCTASVFGQDQTIGGQVTDGKGEAVPFATIVLSADSAAAAVSAFAVSGTDGRFAIKVKGGAARAWVTARCVGYKTYKQKLKSTNELRITMEQDSKALDGIVVRGTALGAKVSNDTVTFAPEVFRNGSEQNMADVIKKLPGMEVQEDGSMTFKGKKVDKFLVDGREALSGGGSVKTLPPDFAQSVELLENYSDGDVANSFTSRRTTAMNLKTDGKHKTAVSATLMGGAKDKYDVRAAALYFGKQTTVGGNFNVNNTGEAVFSVMDYINASGGISAVTEGNSGQTALQLSDEERAMLSDGSDDHSRTAGIVSANATLDTRRNYKATLSAIGNAVDSKSRAESDQTFYAGADTLSRHISKSGNRDGRLASATLTQKVDKDGRLSFRARTKMLWNKGHDDNDENEAGLGLHADRTSSRAISFSQTAGLNILAGKQLVYLGLEASYRHSDATATAATAYELPELFSAQTIFSQEREKDDYSLSGQAGIVVPLFKGVGVKGELFAGTNHENMLSRQTANAEEELVNGRAGAYVGFTRSAGLWTFDVGTRLSAFWRRFDAADAGNRHSLRLEPSAAMSWQFNKRSRLNASFSYDLTPYALTQMTRQTILRAHDNVSMPSKLDGEGSRDLNVNISYTLFSIFSRTTLYAAVSYGKSTDPGVADYGTDGSISYSTLLAGGLSETAQAMTYFSKGLGHLPVDAKISVDASLATADIERNAVRAEMKNSQIDTKLTFTSRIRRSPVNGELSANYAWAESEVQSMGISTASDIYGAKASIIIAHGPFHATITGKWNRTTNDADRISETDADVSAAYKIKRFTIRLSGTDIFHLDGRDWLTDSTTPVVTTTASYGRMAGNIMAGVSFTL